MLTLTIICLIPVLIYIYFKQKHSYWAKKGVPFFPPSIPFGNITDFVLKRRNISQVFRDFYFLSKQNGFKYIGVYLYARKGVFVIEPDLVKRVLSIDFQYFHDRDLYFDEINDPLSANLLSLTGQKWKNLRSKLTPTFTSGKLKLMCKTVLNCADELITILESKIDSSIEIKEVLSRYTIDVIGCCAFGINCNSLKNPDTEFEKNCNKALTLTMQDVLKLAVFKNFPRLAKLLKMKQISTDVSTFFINVVKQTIEHREQNNIERSDFMQLLIQLKNNRKLDNNRTKNSEVCLTFNEIAAQSFLFFLAGYETSSTVVSFALFEIAKSEMIQDKIRNEILTILKGYNSEITYDAIMEMHYMEKVILESMRKYPPVPILLRKCTKNYKIPDTDVIIEEGSPIFVSIWGLHSDPKYYPNPDHFDPDRFDKINTKNRPEYTYLPFGNGPRVCIGERFGMMQIKIALALLLSNFKFTLNKKTQVPLTFDKNKQLVLNVVGGIWLNIHKLKD